MIEIGSNCGASMKEKDHIKIPSSSPPSWPFEMEDVHRGGRKDRYNRRGCQSER